MSIYSKSISLKTQAKIDLVNITSPINNIISESGIKEGLAVVFSPHTTSGLIINENEGGLVSDIKEAMKDIIDWRKNYYHNRVDNNAPAHITGSIIGNSLALPVNEGSLELGTWQSVFFAELDGPRSRQVYIKIFGD